MTVGPITYVDYPEVNARDYSHPGCTEPEGRRWRVPLDDALAPTEDECEGCLRWLPVVPATRAKKDKVD